MIYFIVNPAAGAGRAKTAVPIIEQAMRGHEHTFIYTEAPADSARVGGLIDWSIAESIVCVGGDGTAQEYIGLAVGRDINFGIVPVGSGNDMLLSVPAAAPKFLSLGDKTRFYAEKIIRREIMPADAVSVNGGQYFFNIGGTGIDIEVLKGALPLKKFIGGAAYFISLIKNAATYSAGQITLTVDGKPETDRFLLLAVCNGAYYGGGLKVAPPAVINDGYITLCKARNMTRLKLMAMFPRVKSGGHTKLAEVSLVNCSSVKLEFEGARTINLDGNLHEYTSPVTFKIMPGAVRLIV